VGRPGGSRPAASDPPAHRERRNSFSSTAAIAIAVPWTRSSGRKPFKIKVQAKVEHPIRIIRRVFGFAKVRYRGLQKNAHRLLMACALANLFIARRHLLRCDMA
jgi:IS5 family transposase